MPSEAVWRPSWDLNPGLSIVGISALSSSPKMQGTPWVWPHPKGSGPLQAGQFILRLLNMPFPARGRGCNVCEKNV